MTKILKTIKMAFALAKINFQLRIEGSYLGIFWYLLNPLAMFAIIMVIRQAAVISAEIPYYSLYLFIGISGFNFFKKTLNEAIKTITGNASLIKASNDINLESLVIANSFQFLFSHVFEIAILFLIAIFLKVSLVGLIFYPLILFFFILMITGLSFIFSVIGVYVNDWENVWSIVSQILFLGSPIFYILSPETFLYKINLFNPLFYFLESARSVIIYSKTPDPLIIFGLAIFSITIFIFGKIIFTRYKNHLAEKI